MGLIPYVEKSNASPDVAALYGKLELKYKRSLFNSLKMLGHLPEVLEVFVPFADALMKRGKLDRRVKELAVLRTTILNKCNYCATHRYYSAKLAGLTHAEIMEVHRFRESARFSEREKLAMAFAEEVTLHPGELNADLLEAARKAFDPASLVELTAAIGMMNFMNRFDNALAVDPDLPQAPLEFYPKRERWMNDDD